MVDRARRDSILAGHRVAVKRRDDQTTILRLIKRRRARFVGGCSEKYTGYLVIHEQDSHCDTKGGNKRTAMPLTINFPAAVFVPRHVPL